MNYGLLIFGELDRDRLAAALADLLSLTPDSVDVGDEGDDDRNWDAPVSCTVTPLTGDLHWHLDIYLSNTLPTPPVESDAAAWLANRLRTVVAYESVPLPPSAYWLVGPDGQRTRARIYEEDSDDAAVYRIDAVEHPLVELPGLPVAPLPEVIHSYRMPTPITDRLREHVAGDVSNLLGAWEAMVARLVEGWPPDGWYPAEFYREDLTTRDDLADVVEALAQPVKDTVERAVAEVDSRFAAATEDDGGKALAAATHDVPVADRWWWRRISRPLPWRDAPTA
ncbi:hypothetical protein [Actinoplanes sp. NPDC049316]|uniref:hypothetical protein n=1 Tax=Actinoplanes sp. NPDC049316 TaxID=3154727 RepID=UPI00341867C0